MIPSAQVPDGIAEFESGFGPRTWLVRTRAGTSAPVAEMADRLRPGQPRPAG